ncbi:MAG: nucleotidyl transferase AbiEii/AbiGii toxin family protein [Treponema sp.]|nr:nucleotidyl transferase AbiEii/AbiGii toxin family protein [Treponema sp.]
MLSYQTVEPHTLELLRRLMEAPLLRQTRLVGGTALALQYGHRSSVDLDFFGEVEATTEELSQVLGQVGAVTLMGQGKMIKGFVVDGVRIDIVSYAYPWIEEAVVEDGLRLASPADIAAMKVYAIENRGSRKDFIDMYFLLKHYSLDEILSFYKRKYPEHSEFVALRSLTYFEDAESFAMPKMYVRFDWEELKRSMIAAVSQYTS